MLTLAYTISIVAMILIPVALAAGLRRVTLAAWLLFSIGSLTFIVSQAVHLPLNEWLADLGWLPGSNSLDVPIWQTALILGLTAGLCEELARAGGYALLQRFKPGWLRLPDAVMLGLGHGGIEAMIFGGILTAATLSSLLPLRGADLSPLGLTGEQLEVLNIQLAALESPWRAALPLLERLLAISAHVVFSLLVWRAFSRRQIQRDWYYILIAIFYHMLVDAGAVWIISNNPVNPLLLQLAFAAALLPGWIWAVWSWRTERMSGRQPANPAAASLPRSSLGDEWQVFWIALHKELRQLWRTRRLLVMGAVFLVFGMGSPLLAKFTPEMLGMIEGAEMFTGLIPTPTAGDAMTQYLKNLTQFGFILAVLLGMGAVVGEKERGVAPMILSKPMPRWAFIASKFTAQALMYLLVLLLSGLGAYYYTVILFGGLDMGGFAMLNGLLLLWLLVFVGLSLVASTLGGSTAAAGGIGLGLSAALMLAGNLPNYGQLLPGGLIGWATLVGMQAAGVEASMPGANVLSGQALSNGGAAACALVFIVMALVFSVGVFEQQEL
jgi:ABC-2 type transport system permease protein